MVKDLIYENMVLCVQEVDIGNMNQRKPPPYPKKMYEYLNNHIIGEKS